MRRVFAVGNRSQVSVFQQVTPDLYQPVVTEATSAGARNSLLIPEHRRLIIAGPMLAGDQAARLYIYQIGQ
jgi:hypothetical protein